jgi:hypothetical protein
MQLCWILAASHGKRMTTRLNQALKIPKPLAGSYSHLARLFVTRLNSVLFLPYFA